MGTRGHVLLGGTTQDCLTLYSANTGCGRFRSFGPTSSGHLPEESRSSGYGSGGWHNTTINATLTHVACSLGLASVTDHLFRSAPAFFNLSHAQPLMTSPAMQPPETHDRLGGF